MALQRLSGGSGGIGYLATRDSVFRVMFAFYGSGTSTLSPDILSKAKGASPGFRLPRWMTRAAGGENRIAPAAGSHGDNGDGHRGPQGKKCEQNKNPRKTKFQWLMPHAADP